MPVNNILSIPHLSPPQQHSTAGDSPEHQGAKMFYEVFFHVNDQDEARQRCAELLGDNVETRGEALVWLMMNSTIDGRSILAYGNADAETLAYTFDERVPFFGGQTITVPENYFGEVLMVVVPTAEQQDSLTAPVNCPNSEMLPESKSQGCYIGNMGYVPFSIISKYLPLNEATKLSKLNKHFHSMYTNHNIFSVVKGVRDDMTEVTIHQDNLEDFLNSPFSLIKYIHITNMDAPGIIRLCNYLSQHPPIISLSLPAFIPTDDLITLFSGTVPQLKQLKMHDCYVDEDVLTVIADSQPYLEHLEMISCRIGDNGAEIISARIKNLQHLDLYDNGITNIGVGYIAKNIPDITYVDLSGNKFRKEGVMEIITHRPNWRELHIQNCGIIDTALATLVKNLQFLKLQALNVHINPIKESYIQSIAEMHPKINMYPEGR